LCLMREDYLDVAAPGHLLRKFSGACPKLGMEQ
jgi:hypothetical protein